MLRPDFVFRIYVSSYVARQTVVGHFILSMAAHTPAHGHSNKRFCRRFFALGDPSMAVLTLDLSENDMATMRIEDMIGLVVDLLPGYCFLLFCKLPDLLLLRTLGNRFFMALQTDGDIRHSGESLGLIVLVTGVTFQPLFGMPLVIEGDRLVGFRAYGVVDKEEKQRRPRLPIREGRISCPGSPGLR